MTSSKTVARALGVFLVLGFGCAKTADVPGPGPGPMGDPPIDPGVGPGVDADGDPTCTSPSAAPVATSAPGPASTVVPLDLSVAVPNITGTFGIAAQGADGKFLVGARATNGSYLVRYGEDGRLDTTFGTGGRADLTTPAQDGELIYQSFRVLPSGAIVAIGIHVPSQTGPTSGPQPEELAVRRFGPDGTADAAFGKAGIATLGFGTGTQATLHDWAITPDGKNVVAAVEVTTNSTAPNPNDRSAYFLARVDEHGAFDASFGANGQVKVTGFDIRFAPPHVGVQRDGRIVFASNTGEYPCGQGQYCPPNTWLAITRYLANGQPDTSFTAVSTKSDPDSSYAGTLLLPSGKMLDFGRRKAPAGCSFSSFFIDRRNIDGSPDTHYGTIASAACDSQGGFSSNLGVALHGVALQGNGGLLIGGDSGQGNTGSDSPSSAIIRFNACGVRDLSFGSGGQSTLTLDPSFKPKGDTEQLSSSTATRISEISTLPDGHIVATASTFSVLNGVSCAPGPNCPVTIPKVFVVRLDARGAWEPSFPAP